MLFKSIALLAPIVLLTPACGGDDGGSDGADESGTGDSGDTEESGDTDATCFDLQHAIVSDIDETLTLSDGEFLMQLADSTYDPIEREEGAELITDYHDRGFHIVYLTARAEVQSSADNETPARQLTEEWLDAHGFPFDENTRVVMADNFVFGDTAAAYKGQALMDIQAEGFTFDYAYGNATSDIFDPY